MAAGLSTQAQAMPASIPVIDIGGLYSSDPAARKAAAAKLGAACDDIGFFYAVNHNVSVEVIDRAVAMADKFVHLPEAERRFLEQIYAYQLILHQGWKHLSEYRQTDGGSQTAKPHES